MTPWIGNGLLTSSGKYWARNRRLITPGFHFDVLKPYVKIYNECVARLIAYFEERSKKGSSIEIFEPVSVCTLNTIMRCSFSSSEDVEVGEESQYVKCINSMSYYIFQRMFNPLCYFDSIYFLTKDGKEFLKHCEYSHSVTRACITKRKETLKHGTEQQKKHLDFLDILLLARDEDGNALTDKEICDEVETFMFEGHDTTASAISWCLYNLARHPDIQARAQEEADELLKDKSDIEWNDFNDLNYIGQCIKESMRLNPTVTFVQRELTKPMTILGQKILPGTPVEVNIWAIHHNREVWGEDHMKYDPDRFLPEKISKMDSYSFLPFSAGPRNCIGQTFALQEMKVYIAQILHHFKMSLDKDHLVEMAPEVVNRAKHGIKIFFDKRL